MEIPSYGEQLTWLRQEQEETERNIAKHESSLTHLKLNLEVAKAEIAKLEKKMVTLRKPVTKCSCGKEAPESRRLVTGGGGVYCLDCGYEILNLLKKRNDNKEEQSYKEFYDQVNKKMNSQL